MKHPSTLLRSMLHAAAVTVMGVLLAYYYLDGLAVFGVDDANITHAYARNLAEGFGPVYYPGGEAVEGSTSFLWTIINSGLWWGFGEWPPAYVAVCVGLSFGAVTLAMLIWDELAGELGQPAGLGRLVVSGAFLCSPTWFIWNAWSLMDVTLWTFALALAVYLLMLCFRNGLPTRWLRIALPASLVLLVATRPEGIAMAMGLVVVQVILAMGADREVRAAHLRLAVWSVLALVAVFAALTIMRLAVYGYPAPNTYYAKSTHDLLQRFDDGLIYTARAFLEMPVMRFGFIAIAALACVRLWPHRARGADMLRHNRQLLVVGLSTFGLVLLVVLLGGDHFLGFRFYQPALPLLACGLAGVVTMLFQMVARSKRNVAVMAMCGLGVAAPVIGLRGMEGYGREMAGDYTLATEGRRIGDELNVVASQGEPVSIAVVAAGGVGVRYRGGPIYDAMGLNWTQMAHSSAPRGQFGGHVAFDPDILLATRPDILLSGAVRRGRDIIEVQRFEYMALKGLFDLPAFRAAYVPAEMLGGSGRVVFLSRQAVDRLNRQGQFRVRSWRSVRSDRSMWTGPPAGASSCC